MTEDFWPEIGFGTISNNDSLELIKEQIKPLEEKTHGMIKASFSKVRYSTSLADSLARITEPLQKIEGFSSKELEENELNGKEDYNDHYRKTEYKFVIYSDKYKFCIFRLNYSEEYPITIIADEGIREELKMDYYQTIRSNAQLKDVLKQILSSSKVKNILSRMFNSKNDESTNVILEYLKSTPGAREDEISAVLSQSKKTTIIKLKELENNGLIRKDGKGLLAGWYLV